MKGGDSTVNLGVVFPRGAVDPSSRPSLAPRLSPGEKYHRRWVIEGSSNTSRILSRLVRVLYRFCIDFEFESTSISFSSSCYRNLRFLAFAHN